MIRFAHGRPAAGVEDKEWRPESLLSERHVAKRDVDRGDFLTHMFTAVLLPGYGRSGQAALARRIRRRRSDARSSSFKPPHVPYFSGREIA